MSTSLERIIVSQIQPSSHQARKQFDEQSLKDLADSMLANGLLHPIAVRKLSEPTPTHSFELISGERRWRAAKLLGWTEIQAQVFHDRTEEQAAVMGMIENLQRENLDPIEEAEGFAMLQRLDLTQDQIAAHTGKGRSYVNQSLQLLQLPDEVKQNVSRGTFSRSHAEELMRLPTAEMQIDVAKKIPGHLTVEQTRRLVEFLSGMKPKPKKAAASKKAASEDPLSDIWPQLVFDPSIAMPGSWTVRFIPPNRWVFEVAGDASNAQTVLGQWFSKMTKALAETRQSSFQRPASLDITTGNSIDGDAETRALIEEQLKRGGLL